MATSKRTRKAPARTAKNTSKKVAKKAAKKTAKKTSRIRAKGRVIPPNESRRGFIRVDFESGSQVSIKGAVGQRREVAYDALDLSVYGLSFLAGSEDSIRFLPGLEIPLLAFVVNGRRVSVAGRVAYVRSGLIKGLAKVAVEFTNILVDDVWWLSKYVAIKSGVDKPHQLGHGMLELKQLRRSSRKPRSRQKKKARK